MEEIERAQERLQHIRSVEPILDALRMIALGSWQKATKQQAVSQAYSDRLLAVLPWLLPHLPQPGWQADKQLCGALWSLSAASEACAAVSIWISLPTPMNILPVGRRRASR